MPISLFDDRFNNLPFEALGLVLGRDDLVGSSCQPVANGRLHHLEMVLGSTPYRRATLRMDQCRYTTKLTASRRTLAIWGFVV